MKIFERFRSSAAALLFLPLLPGTLRAQAAANSTESGCLNSHVVSVPSRPTVTNATDPTQCGVVEVEYGYDHQWLAEDKHHDDLAGGLRFGLTPNLDFHWFSASLFSVADAGGSRSGFGDTWLGLKYRFVTQTKRRPSFAVFYAAKIPSASYLKGLGSGEVDHSVSFLASKDISRLHLDFNLIELIAGRPVAPGNDHSTGFALASWLTLTRHLALVVEPYGYTQLNQSTGAFASMMAGCNFKVGGRTYLDAGVDFGMTHEAADKRAYVGATYALANVYTLIKPRR